MAGGDTKILPVFTLDIVEKGGVFNELPKHITLIPPLSTPYLEEHSIVLRGTMNSFVPFTVVTGEIDFFGPDQDIPVRRIQPSDSLQLVHKALVSTVAREILYDRTYTEPYNPHITAVENVLLPANRVVLIGGFAVFQKKSDEEWSVVDKIGFKGEEGV